MARLPSRSLKLSLFLPVTESMFALCCVGVSIPSDPDASKPETGPISEPSSELPTSITSRKPRESEPNAGLFEPEKLPFEPEDLSLEPEELSLDLRFGSDSNPDASDSFKSEATSSTTTRSDPRVTLSTPMVSSISQTLLGGSYRGSSGASCRSLD